MCATPTLHYPRLRELTACVVGTPPWSSITGTGLHRYAFFLYKQKAKADFSGYAHQDEKTYVPFTGLLLLLLLQLQRLPETAQLLTPACVSLGITTVLTVVVAGRLLTLPRYVSTWP